MTEYTLSGAFIVGLMGAAHCFGMCGGLIAAFSSGLPSNSRYQLSAQFGFLLSYNLGRILSYTIAGALVGASVSILGHLFSIDHYLVYLRLLAGVMLVLTGLYIAQIWFGIVAIEKLGRGLWQIIKPLANKLLPISTKKQAFIAGMLWGWLPCGLVYSTLTWSIAAGNAIEGGAIMFFFGLGTLPALLSAGLAAEQLAKLVRAKAFRLFGGCLLILFGLHTVYIGFMQL